jgi:1-hydroxycarotenoid 3,4-desaturase
MTGIGGAQSSDHHVVVGAGIAGLAAAARLAHAGLAVTVLERHATPGGRMRQVDTSAGPVDAGPTVLTLRAVFDDLFAALDERLEDHLRLLRLPLLARHFWPDGSQLDLSDDGAANARAIRGFGGPGAEREFLAFGRRARALFDGFDAPMMKAPRPSPGGVARALARTPRLAADMAPLSTLAGLLRHSFSDPRLAQLFGRYATYVGGSPYQSPALLALIWQAEASGVWAVEGGLHRLARALERIAADRGAIFRYGADVDRIETADGRAIGVTLTGGERIAAGAVLFNGDPRALAVGALGPEAAAAVPGPRRAARSLSADVWAFAARAEGVELAHHTVFFCADPAAEFALLARGIRSPDPTLYVCAMDRDMGRPASALERFEIIANAPPVPAGAAQEDEATSCRTRTFGPLARFGLRFSPSPGDTSLTTPRMFDRLFPHSAGSLYGQSPHGMMAAFRRPTARTSLPGLYLAGGGTHPGAGVPMATLSAGHAVAAILSDRTSASRSRRAVTPGGTSTDSPRTASAQSPSSAS